LRSLGATLTCLPPPFCGAVDGKAASGCSTASLEREADRYHPPKPVLSGQDFEYKKARGNGTRANKDDINHLAGEFLPSPYCLRIRLSWVSRLLRARTAVAAPRDTQFGLVKMQFCDEAQGTLKEASSRAGRPRALTWIRRILCLELCRKADLTRISTLF
jgi:hypothetical protein